MRIIFNEESLLEEMLEDGFSQKYPTFRELLVLAKHLRNTYGYGEKRIIGELESFCSEKIMDFNTTLSRGVFTKVAKEAIKKPDMRTPRYPIVFSGEEIEKIRGIPDFPAQKIIFSAISQAKSTGSPEFFSDSNKNLMFIVRISGEKVSKKYFIEKVSPIAYQNEIFEFVNRKSSFYKVLLKGGQNVVLSMSSDTEFLNAGKVYENFVGGVLGWCLSCGKEFYKLSGKHNLCEACGDENRKSLNRARVARFRGK